MFETELTGKFDPMLGAALATMDWACGEIVTVSCGTVTGAACAGTGSCTFDAAGVVTAGTAGA